MKETKVQNDIRRFLGAYGWGTWRMHGNAYQKGIPDLYARHPDHGPRWVEVKLPGGGYGFTRDQLIQFPRFEGAGDEIWIMTAATREEYLKLFEPENWRSYLKPRHLKLMEALRDGNHGL
jgi:hypothetical protein